MNRNNDEWQTEIMSLVMTRIRAEMGTQTTWLEETKEDIKQDIEEDIKQDIKEDITHDIKEDISCVNKRLHMVSKKMSECDRRLSWTEERLDAAQKKQNQDVISHQENEKQVSEALSDLAKQIKHMSAGMDMLMSRTQATSKSALGGWTSAIFKEGTVKNGIFTPNPVDTVSVASDSDDDVPVCTTHPSDLSDAEYMDGWEQVQVGQ